MPRLVGSSRFVRELLLPAGVILRRVEVRKDRFVVGGPFGDECCRRSEQRVDTDIWRKLFDARGERPAQQSGMTSLVAERWHECFAVSLRPASQQVVEHFGFEQRMIGGDQQPSVIVGRSESLSDGSQADLDAVSHVGRFVIRDDGDRGCPLHCGLQRDVVRAHNDDHCGDVGPSQRGDQLFDDSRSLPGQQQFGCPHASAASGGWNQSEHAVSGTIHVAILRSNRNHPWRLCLLEPKLAMPNNNSDVCHPSALEPEMLLRGCTERRVRRSGPGGQHRNKVETGVVLRHESTGTEAEANERRSQAENRQVAVFRLRVRLAVEFRTVRSADAVPSELWRSRCRGGRVSVNPSHLDFPALLAEALDVLAMCEYDQPIATSLLGCTGSQLVKFLKEERSAFEKLNRERIARGLPRLK